ncbi:DUF6705 family protein [Flavobacterium sp. CLA17]|uniref:DUF6705 family protein n=1 Tax=Flavobacterium sp. CLA17 TaxID=2724135 RepID=UPI001491ADEE|nr:DUF6705 family protein [Flavobacterium sp. CLA17]QSB25856.1 hypothetical protein HAV12_015915 [Flavobacterium sp. CLA17]
MKKIIIIGITIACISACKAQSVVPIEKKIDYINAGIGIPESVTYFKDVNGIRDKYVGTWRGTYEGKNYELIFSKITDKPSRITQDRLVMRYLIKDANGRILEDTRAETDKSGYVLKSYYYDKTFFVLSYGGRQFDCGQRGELYVMLTKNYDSVMELFLIPQRDIILEKDCPNGAAAQLFPEVKMRLTRQ